MRAITCSTAAAVLLLASVGCSPTPRRETPVSSSTALGEPRYLQAQGNWPSATPLAAARAAWRERVRELCGSDAHEEEMVYEYTYSVIAEDPRDRMVGVREGYVRCKATQ